MFEALKDQPQDKILQLMTEFRADSREGKIDLGVGVYRDAEGRTPVMRAVKEAERRLWEQEATKSYTSLAGEPDFAAAMRELILADAVDPARVAAAATPGGTGAVRQAFELVKMAAPGARVWVSDPTWPNHLSILRHLGMEAVEYRYVDRDTSAFDRDGMLADLEGIRAGDLVLLHGCCHNPTGANPNAADWEAIAAQLERSGATVLVDLAYQGFGDGLEADAAATRMLAARLPEVLIAASCSKNFGIYRERTGILFAVGPAELRARAQANLAYLNRQAFSFPPDHGARVVTMILSNPELRETWERELSDMRETMLALRRQLAEELRRRTNSDRFDVLARHRGMFSLLPASPAQVAAMREGHGIYMVGDGRINVAGLSAGTVPALAAAMVDAGV